MWLSVTSTVFIFILSFAFLGVNGMPGKLSHPEDAEFLSESFLNRLHQHILKAHHIANLNQSDPPREIMEAILSPEFMQGLPAETLPKIEDDTTFAEDLGGWVILGQWARYHLPFFNTTPPVPLVPRSTDQIILLCNITKFPSTISKTLPGMTKGHISMEHFVQFGRNMSLEATLISDSKTETIFNMTTSDLQKNNSKWVNSTFQIPPHLHNMTITIRPRGNGTAVWAVNSINVTGIKASPNSPEFQTTQKPTVPPTTISPVKVVVVNGTVAPGTNTTVFSPMINNSTNATKGTNATLPPQTTTKVVTNNLNAAAVKEDPLKEIHGIATAIWDAFYVFLALFCACLIALVVLIFRQRCRNEESSPTMSTYNPRPSNFQVDRTRDNPAYQSDSV